MGDKVQLSGQQLAILGIIWQQGQATAAQVLSGLDGDKAHTTVATHLSRLEKRGVLRSDFRGREKVYTALVSADEVRRSMVSTLLSGLFKDDPKALMAHLVHEGDIEAGDLDDIKQMLDAEGDKP